jgi:beta-mannosidase
MPAADPLAGAGWECAAGVEPAEWIPAEVPGTAAGALRDAGRWDVEDARDFDAEDWWFRTTFDAEPGGWTLCLDGLATIAEVTLNGVMVHRSEAMFTPYRVPVTLEAANELTIRFVALGPVVSKKHPRPRWRTRMVTQQHLRWYRTTFLGRMPGWAPVAAPVGPWRPVRLTRSEPVRLRATADGTVHVEAPGREVEVDGVRAPLVDGRATVRLDSFEPWWPHTHGTPTLYEVRVDGDVVGRVGFRTVDADRDDGGFTLRVNGERVFCRGACWVPPDVVTLNASARPSLERMRDAGMNMVRLIGPLVYEDQAFWDACDELGILVWQDAMFANVDPPDDETFLATVEAELSAVLVGAVAHPSLAVVCGGSEVEQQAAMLGLDADRRALPLFDTHLPKLLERLEVDVPYVPSSPTGGDLPFRADTGITHYYGVGAYLRPLEDARRANVRFAAESLAFATPPERAAVEEWFGGSTGAGHHPRWKRSVPRDNGAAWDFEDVRDHYVRRLFDVDPAALRYADPDRYLDLGRAAVAEVMTATLTEWRRPGSSCDGALVLLLRDLYRGAGWGLLDADGNPKAPMWALRRVLDPIAVLATDEGLNGLHLHVVNDRAEALRGVLDVEVFDAAGQQLEAGSVDVDVPGRGGVTVSAESAFGGFRDLTWAYRFGPRAYDAVVATFRADGVVRDVVFLPGGPARPREADVGLRATVDGGVVTLTTERLAQHVSLDVPGFVAADSWFHLPPGATRTIGLTGEGRPTGEVRALNAGTAARLVPA